jgi:hypothetical protein
LGTLTVSGSTLSGNSADYGGGIANGGTLTVMGSTVSGNTSNYYGGGISDGGTLTVMGSTVSGNYSNYYGGGIYIGYSGPLTVTVSNSTLSGNTAGAGGGIANLTLFGALTVSNSTLSGNSAGLGGGIYNRGTLTVTGSTLSGNSAGYGGGIYTDHGARAVTLTNVTLTANRAQTSAGGGLYVYSGSAVLHNTLIARNFRGATGTTRDDVFGNPGGDYNLIGDGSGMTGLTNGVNGNLVGSADMPIDPLLGPLQDNGGPTKTHALLSGSPAIDAGNNAYATVAVQLAAEQGPADHFVVRAGHRRGRRAVRRDRAGGGRLRPSRLRLPGHGDLQRDGARSSRGAVGRLHVHGRGPGDAHVHGRIYAHHTGHVDAHHRGPVQWAESGCDADGQSLRLSACTT